MLTDFPGIRLLEFNENYRAGFKNIVVELLDEWPLPRSATIEILNAENILARAYYYPPLHRKSVIFPRLEKDLPLTDLQAEKFMNLPCGQLVSIDDIRGVIDMLDFVYRNADPIAERLSRSN